MSDQPQRDPQDDLLDAALALADARITSSLRGDDGGVEDALDALAQAALDYAQWCMFRGRT